MSGQEDPYHIPHSSYVGQAEAQVAWPHPSKFDVPGLRSRIDLLLTAPWLDPLQVRYDDRIEQIYALAGFLPDETPVRALRSADWCMRCCAPSRALHMFSGETEIDARRNYITKVMQRSGRSYCRGLIDDELGFDTWQYRTPIESNEGEFMRDVYDVDTSEWTATFHLEAMPMQQPILPVEFRYVRRTDSVHCSETHLDFLRWERWIRGKFKFLVPYQCVEFPRFRRHEWQTRYIRLPRDWSRWEVPEELQVELPCVLTYFWQRLLSQDSPVWVMFYTEWVARVAAALLWECYDSSRLFWVPPAIQRAFRAMDLSQVLGSPENYRELLELLEVIEATHWVNIPQDQRKRQLPP